MSTHFESISRGVFDSKDIIYFLSIVMLGLVGSEAVLTKRD
jgi:ABC-2 type transport system permease protein